MTVSRSNLMDVSDIAKMLADKIDSLVLHLLPAAVKEGHEWRIGSCAGEKGRSMAIHSGGSKPGVWSDFSAGKGGDALELVAEVKFGGDKKTAVSWAKSWLGLDGMDPARLQEKRQEIAKKAKENEKKSAEELERKRRYAHAMWLEALAIKGSPVETYLTVTRGIPLAELSRQPNALRYAPALKYPPAPGMPDEFYPAMVAAIFDAQGKYLAVHRTYLQMHPDGRVTKANVPEAKKVLGSYRGGFIPLSRGPSGRSIKDAPNGDKVLLCEGIEDGLSLAWAMPEYRVLATVSVSNFQNIILPQTITDVLLARDADAAGSEADTALMNAVQIISDQGRDVSIASPPPPFKDFNQMLCPADGAAVSVRGVS